jgi:hypothetical protein
MCECYKIGGRFIAEDPECPVHGSEAQRSQREEESERQALEDRITALEEIVELQNLQIRRLAEMVSQTGNE